jgi:hypothetical protein
MKLNVMSDAGTLDDAHLVELGLNGDRDAFGRLVAYYQFFLNRPKLVSVYLGPFLWQFRRSISWFLLMELPHKVSRQAD